MQHQFGFNVDIFLPNKKRTRVFLDDQRHTSYISQSIVDTLLKTGEIVVEGDRAFVDFH